VVADFRVFGVLRQHDAVSRVVQEFFGWTLGHYSRYAFGIGAVDELDASDSASQGPAILPA
jgi:hypothetical protein